MIDLVLSLEWVRDNIANFGGDPQSVMIFGQSGGGGKVNTLMAMPSAKGLYQRAAVQSGSILKVGDPHDSYELAAAVMKELNISPSDVDQLQMVPTDKLLLAATTAQRSLMPPRSPNAPPVNFRRLGRLLGWQPVVDGKVIPQHEATVSILTVALFPMRGGQLPWGSLVPAHFLPSAPRHNMMPCCVL